ncbi:sulfotransferase family 2 domain-containing protein [Rhodocaloribacter sp.]
MAILCENLGLLYIQVPATGCSVVGKVLREQFGGVDIGRKHDDVPRLLAQGHLSESALKRFCIVANVRNPFDRLVTYYQRLNGAWIDEYFAFRRRRLERLREREELDDAAYRKTQEDISREEQRKHRRVRIIKGVGFNAWVVSSILRWRMRDRSKTVSGPHRYFHHLFPIGV